MLPGGDVDTDTSSAVPTDRGSEADALFMRVYPAMVGLVRRIIDRDGSDRAALRTAEDVAVDVMAWARTRRLHDTDEATTRIAGRTLDRCVDLLLRPGLQVPLPPGLEVEDLADGDVLDDGARLEWTTSGLRLEELHVALADTDRRTRRVGTCCLAAGLSPEDTAALLDLRGDETVQALARIGEQLTAHRRSAALGATTGRQ